ncbi:MAG: hypothetical protein O3C23_01635 [bacterium]|nr:hypothetical protein [bacterium]
MKKHSLVRTIYLYLFALIGLVLVVIGSVRFLDMGLKAFVFTKADEEQRLWYKQPPYPSVRLEQIAMVEGEKVEPKEEITLSKEEKAEVDLWIAQYKSWQETQGKIDPVTSNRQRDASTSLAMMLIGIPLYLFHWRWIKKDVQET